MQYHTSEDQNARYFHPIIYDVHTYHWWYCDEKRTSTIDPEEINYVSFLEDLENNDHSISNKK